MTTIASPGDGSAVSSPGSTSFTIHAVATFVALCVLNWMVVNKAPLQIEMLETSYLIFFYHFPSAFLFTMFLATNAVFSGIYLGTKNPRYDVHARIFGELGLVACMITLGTGSVWARMAWGEWWSFDDKRLLFAAVTCLTYAGYVLLQRFMEPGERRMRFAAVFALIAVVNVPLVKFAIDWFGKTQHPAGMTSTDAGLKATQWFGVVAFLLLYLLIYRWQLRREQVQVSIEATLAGTRRLEEGSPR